MERMRFVEFWADYVRIHDDPVWSRQKNVIIDSCMKSANLSKEVYPGMKNEKRDTKKNKMKIG